MAQVCLSHDAEFINKNKILPNSSVCRPNYSHTKLFVNQCPTVPLKTHNFPKVSLWGTKVEEIKSHMAEFLKIITENLKKINKVFGELKNI